eukprot:TRINITY_DN1633_c0_g2_i1.p1 TRINITY_DN1633_c0_g2~~TRINITY_DN1633_c0_g2_i1.p1  ORF type:complete len:253 (-),score=29.43 TRINITY_DN1633_c0_g2_i1:43-801(-)
MAASTPLQKVDFNKDRFNEEGDKDKVNVFHDAALPMAELTLKYEQLLRKIAAASARMCPVYKIRAYQIKCPRDAMQRLCDEWFPSHHIPCGRVIDLPGARSTWSSNSSSCTALYNGTTAWRKRFAINSCHAPADVRAILSSAFNEVVMHVNMRPSHILTKFLGFTVTLGLDPAQVALDLLFKWIDHETLHDLMDRMFHLEQPFPLKQICIIARDMLKIGIELRERHIVHFNLKPANFLYNRKTLANFCMTRS